MADNTAIEWTDATWNPITGCSVVSPGCTNCYAMRLAGTRLRHHPTRAGLTREVNGNHVWTGETRLNEAALLQPLRWKRPRRIFVCAHGDLFHESVPDEWIDKVFAVMALAPQHTFQVLTKRADMMREYFRGRSDNARHAIWDLANDRLIDRLAGDDDAFTAALNRLARWPLPNVWLGVSVEDQARADERIPALLATPAAVRFLSCEPLLGPVNLRSIGLPDDPNASCFDLRLDALTGFHSGTCRPESRHGVYSLPRQLEGLDWIIVGGESGPGARPLHPDWARSLRDQCQAAFVPLFFKQWGEWAPGAANSGEPGDGLLAKVGKKRAGRLLDGREWSEFPA